MSEEDAEERSVSTGLAEILSLPGGGRLVADVDRRDPRRWWLYLHGFGSRRTGAKAGALRAAAASAGASFVAFDARGHGESSGSLSELTVTGLLEDLGAAVAAWVSPNASLSLLGSSLGGLVCAWWASRNPERVHASVLLAPAFGFMPRYLRRMGPAAAAAWSRDGTIRYVSEGIDTNLKYAFALDALSYDEEMLAATYRTDTLVLHGLADERVPWKASTEFAARCTHRPVDVVLLDGTDHRFTGRTDDAARRAVAFLEAPRGR